MPAVSVVFYAAAVSGPASSVAMSRTREVKTGRLSQVRKREKCPLRCVSGEAAVMLLQEQLGCVAVQPVEHKSDTSAVPDRRSRSTALKRDPLPPH